MRAAHRLSPWLFASPTALLFFHLPLTEAAASPPIEARVVARIAGADPRFSATPLQVHVATPVEATIELRSARGAIVPLPAGATVRWLQIVPHDEHTTTAAPNTTSTAFSNNVLFGPRHGQWIGFDRIEYDARPLPAPATTTTSTAAAASSAASPAGPAPPAVTITGPAITLARAGEDHGGAGSIWLAAEITMPDGTVLRTPSAGDVDMLGLSRRVLRVSFRESDDFVGWLSTYFHVPNVFGSSGPSTTQHQTEIYTGADCADVLVGAQRAAGNRKLEYTSVAGIGTYARPLTDVLHLSADGVLDATLRWGDDVRRGDLVTIDYADDPGNALPRAWDHIGALVEDGRGPNGKGDGILGGADVMRHMGFRGLHDEPLASQGAIRLRVWRWR